MRWSRAAPTSVRALFGEPLQPLGRRVRPRGRPAHAPRRCDLVLPGDIEREAVLAQQLFARVSLVVLATYAVETAIR